MSYQMRISEQSRKVGRFIASVHREIQNAFLESGLKQNDLAEKLQVDRSIINRRLTGVTNLTLRSIGELAWALDRDVRIVLEPAKLGKGCNDTIHRIETKSDNEDLLEVPRAVTTRSSNSVGEAFEFVDA